MELSELRAAVEASGPRGPGRKFAPELRRVLVQTTQALWGEGEALAYIADALGIHARTAARYLDDEVERDDEPDDDGGAGKCAEPVGLGPAGFVARKIRRWLSLGARVLSEPERPIPEARGPELRSLRRQHRRGDRRPFQSG